MCKQFKVNRICGDYSIVENEYGLMSNICSSLLPDGVVEGDVIVLKIKKDKQ